MRKKISIRLTPDPDGYPPVAVETLWAEEVRPHKYVVGNIPFYAYGLALGDTITAREADPFPEFERVVKPGGHSTLRVVSFDAARVPEYRAALDRIGCSSEAILDSKLFSVDVPPETKIGPVLEYLRREEEEQRASWEEGVMRHSA